MTDFYQRICDDIISVVIIVIQINGGSCQIYKGTNDGYISVPTDIPDGMEKIYLDHNDISHINDESFNETSTDFSRVETLELDGNEIESVSEGAFVGFQNIRIIELRYNQLSDILLHADDIPQLEILFLRKNQFTKIPTFYGFFQSFKKLYLAHNLISHVCEDDFENITNIEVISIENNDLISFEPRQKLMKLIDLDLDENDLTEVPHLKGTYNSLQRIILDDNKIPVESFLTLKEKLNGSEHSLTQLHIGGNADFGSNLSAVINFLGQFPKLKILALPYSNINKIFHLTNSLERLDLSYNNISQITKEDFNVSYRYDAFTLFLTGNPIEALPNLYEYMKDFNSSETYISMQHIKIQCSNLCWMIQIG